MYRIRLFHPDPAQAATRAEILRAAGHLVAAAKEPFDAAVIDLSRLPSQGREIAIALRNAKATRRVPILFVDGEPEKIEPIRQLLPDAIYTSWPRIHAALKQARPLENPVVPPPMMQRYAGRSTAQKLGLKENSSLAVIDPPRDYTRILGALPENVQISEDSLPADVIVCFIRHPEALPRILEIGRTRPPKSKFWICWPKGKTSPIRETLIRESAIALGLVDYKVCSLDATWSGLLFK